MDIFTICRSYFLLEKGGFTASYVNLPEGTIKWTFKLGILFDHLVVPLKQAMGVWPRILETSGWLDCNEWIANITSAFKISLKFSKAIQKYVKTLQFVPLKIMFRKFRRVLVNEIWAISCSIIQNRGSLGKWNSWILSHHPPQN